MIRVISLIIFVIILISLAFWAFNKAFEKIPSKPLVIILGIGVILGVVGSFIFFNLNY